MLVSERSISVSFVFVVVGRGLFRVLSSGFVGGIGWIFLGETVMRGGIVGVWFTGKVFRIVESLEVEFFRFWSARGLLEGMR